MIRKHKPSDEKFPSAATTTSIHLVNSALLPVATNELTLLISNLSIGFHLHFLTQENHTAINSLLYCIIKFSLSNGPFPFKSKHTVIFFCLKKYPDSMSLSLYMFPFIGDLLKIVPIFFFASPICSHSNPVFTLRTL